MNKELLLGILLLVTTSTLAAGERTQPEEKQKLPLNTVLDAEGKPIPLPIRTQSALELPAPAESDAAGKQIRPKPVNSAQSKPKTLNRKQQLANRQSVANDPQCRWLHQRLKQLEATQIQTYGHHQQELKLRMQEWRCLKCGAEGPSQGDHDKCQAR